MYMTRLFSGISISGYQIVSEALTDAQIIQSSKTCNAKFAGSFVTMEDFKNVDFGKIEVVIPSQCDSKYVNHNLCSDQVYKSTYLFGNEFSKTFY